MARNICKSAALLVPMLAACAANAPPRSPAAPSANAAGQGVPSLADTIAAMPKNIPRARAPGLDESIAAARASVQACDAKGAKVSVLIADVEGKPVVLLSGDGAGYRSQLIARSKVATVTRYHMPSGEVEQRAKTDPALAAQAAADPDIGVLRGGGFPIMRGGERIGAIAVSGASLTGPMGLDEECAQAGLALLAGR
jgi:uncharacterized protein GlcG (DUF336 family)